MMISMRLLKRFCFIKWWNARSRMACSISAMRISHAGF